MITVAGVLIGIALMRVSRRRKGWARAAILGQAADLVSFTTVWEFGLGERNPIAFVVLDLARAAFGTGTPAAEVVTSIVLVALKLGLLGYIVAVEGVLGRYRRLALAAAAGAGLIGAVSNVVAYGNAAASLLIVAPFAAVAIRWPDRFGDALGAGARLSLVAVPAFGGLAAFSYADAIRAGYLCDPTICPPALAAIIQAVGLASFGAALLGLWLTLSFSRRLLMPPARVE